MNVKSIPVRPDRKQAIILFVIACFVHLTIRGQQIDYKGLPQWSQQKEGITNYWLYTPDNLEEGKVYPIALFLHGCCPEDEVLRPRSTVDPPVRMWHHFAENTQVVPTYIIAPVSRRGWTQHIENLKKVMDDLVSYKQGDPQRIYITGFSMGGGGTWQFINRYPDYFAAALPMGSGLRGNIQNLKDVPIWANVGEEDRSAAPLKDSISVFRAVNGDPRGALEWVTGVNPRYTEHDGIGHGVQWDAVSTQDLLSWALDKKNDGNAYPVVYFKTPGHLETFEPKDTVPFEVYARDSDSEIDRVEVYLNGTLEFTLVPPPYKGKLRIEPGDNTLAAKAYDQQGKSSTANIMIRTDIEPEILTDRLPDAHQGQYLDIPFEARGNKELTFRLSPGSDPLPEDLSLLQPGILEGIPVVTGNFDLTVSVTDADGDVVEKRFSLIIEPKNENDVVVSNIKTVSGKQCHISKFMKGSAPFSGKNSETNISDPSVYEGLTYIQTDHSERDSSDADYLSFDVDEDVIVYIAYEKCDHLYSSSIPDWLKDYTKENSRQIVTEYFYFDMYSKSFPKGRITLPGANASRNNVNNNYIVLIRKRN